MSRDTGERTAYTHTRWRFEETSQIDSKIEVGKQAVREGV